MKEIVKPLLAWYQENARVLPWRQEPSPYHVWLSEIMLQQTRVEAVKEYYRRFLEHLPTVQDLAEVEEEELLKLWQGLGYYNRVRNLQKAAQIICTQYGGIFPTEYHAWLALPGIGEYTAGAVVSIAFGKKEPAVDGNVYRIYTRLRTDGTDITKTELKKRVRQELLEIMPEDPGGFNQALMDLGAMVCLPNGTPLCDQCPLQTYCKAHQAGTELSYPVKPSGKPRRIEKRTVFLLEYQGRYLLQKRPDRGLLAGLWEFPGQEGHLTLEQVMDGLQDLGVSADGHTSDITLIGKAKHIFSHVEWHMLGYEIHLSAISDKLRDHGVFCTLSELRDTYSIPSAFAVYLKYLFSDPEKNIEK
ncbi:MAG: A/G-specific adenine glycosylase [Eubacteriales bacterium]|nr:A/G-specific adenine glycosylase [Eubacteriales bacterium]